MYVRRDRAGLSKREPDTGDPPTTQRGMQLASARRDISAIRQSSKLVIPIVPPLGDVI
jgi:hypothetical protein